MSIPTVPPDLVDRLQRDVGPAASAPAAAQAAVAQRRWRRFVPRPLRRAGRRVLNRASVRLATLVWPQLERRYVLAEWRASVEAHLVVAEGHLEHLRRLVEASDRSLQALADAVAPAAGMGGVAPRFAELRERVNALERRVRSRAGAGRSAEAAPLRPVPLDVADAIDYVAFERRFRGDPERISEICRERYVPILRGHGPVLDLGCGKGELLENLGKVGIDAQGVDVSEEMVAEARARGLEVRCGDALSVLRELPEHSLGAIVSVHFVEHVPLSYVISLLEVAVSRLRPGGIFVAETPNPTALIVLGTHFIIDPTHLRPIHPALMVFLAESAGFRGVELKFFSPATELQLAKLSGRDLPDWAGQINASLERLNDVLFGPQEYAVIASTPPEPATS